MHEDPKCLTTILLYIYTWWWPLRVETCSILYENEYWFDYKSSCDDCMILVIQNDTSLVYGDDFTNILHIFNCATCDGMTWKLIIFNFPKSIFRKPLNRLCSPNRIVTKAILSISCTLDALFLRLEQMQRHCFCKSAIRKLLIILNMHYNEHPLRRNTKGYGCKTH